MVEGSGHSPQVEKPEETANLILEFAANPAEPGSAEPGTNELEPPNKQTAPKREPKKKGTAKD